MLFSKRINLYVFRTDPVGLFRVDKHLRAGERLSAKTDETGGLVCVAHLLLCKTARIGRDGRTEVLNLNEPVDKSDGP